MRVAVRGLFKHPKTGIYHFRKAIPEKLRAAAGTHSLRRINASIIYKATGNIRAIQILLGHSKIENTVRYLGVDIEDALTLAEKTET